MRAVIAVFNHKLTQFMAVLLLAYLIFQFGVPALSEVLTSKPAPIPAHQLWTIYMPAVSFAMLLFISANEAWWNEFKTPLITLAVERKKQGVVILRTVILVIVPVLVGVATFFRVQPGVEPPPELRAVHPADPGTITIQGEEYVLEGLKSPIRNKEDNGVAPADLMAGREIYVRNCIFCHGDALEGNGMFANVLRPRPANFRDSGTIAQLSESYVFWRVAKGGPGLPPEGTPWNSAMPAWEDELSVEEMWQVIAYIYEATGYAPAERELEEASDDNQ